MVMDFLSCRRLLHRKAVSSGEGCLSLDPQECSWEDLLWQRSQNKDEGIHLLCGPVLDSSKLEELSEVVLAPASRMLGRTVAFRSSMQNEPSDSSHDGVLALVWCWTVPFDLLTPSLHLQGNRAESLPSV